MNSYKKDETWINILKRRTSEKGLEIDFELNAALTTHVLKELGILELADRFDRAEFDNLKVTVKYINKK